jgi:small subunit ribosomal protein S17e
MGRIRPSFVKIRAIKLVNEYPGEFTADFDANKLLVDKYTDGANKRMRNWIAGYVTTYVQRRTD